MSTTGWICFVNNGPVSWCSKRQSITATFTTEAEFIALCSVCKEVVWLRRFLADLNCEQTTATDLFFDNQRAITLVKTPELMKATKHIEVQFYYTCEKQEQGEINVSYANTKEQSADTLTKPLPKEKFQSFGLCYGMI